MTSITDSSHLLPISTSTSTPLIVNICSTDFIEYPPSVPWDDVFYAPLNPSTPLSWAAIAFNGMPVYVMREVEKTGVSVQFVNNVCKSPTHPSTVEQMSTFEWAASIAEKKVSKKCSVCGLKFWQHKERLYIRNDEYEREKVYDDCECEAKCAYVYPDVFSTVRSAKHPTGRSIKRSAKCRTKRNAEQSTKRLTRRAIKC